MPRHLPLRPIETRAPLYHDQTMAAERVIASSANSQRVHLLGDSRAVMQYRNPASSPSLVYASVCATTPKSTHPCQLIIFPGENPKSLLLDQAHRDTLMAVQGNRDKKEAELRAPISRTSGTNRRHNPSFAYKLHAILMDKDCNSAIFWLPSGKSFCIMDKDEFTKKVLPKYFRETKFESFSRRIKRWGFRRMYITGAKQAIYTHDLFQKDRIDLCKLMNGRADHVMTEVNRDGAFNPARFENVMEEQAALADRTIQINSKTAPEKVIRQKPLETTGYPPVSFSRQVPIILRKKPLPMATAYHLMTREHPMFMANFPPEAFASSHWRYPILESRSSYMPYTGMCGLNVVRQLSALDKDIAECEEKLAILHRLKTLKNKRHAFDP